MPHAVLKAEARQVTGKKVKKLRREGLLPANIYGKGLKSLAIQVNLKEFQDIFKEVGETGLIDLKVNNETRPALVKNLQLQYPSHMPLHADFYQVNLKEKVKAMVPIEVTGEAKAVTDNVGILLQQLSEVEVEALPDALPENITVNVSNLAALDEQITVADLKTDEGVAILTDPAQTIVKIAEAVVEEPEPEPTAEEEGAAAEGEEGAAPAEGEGESKEASEGKSEGKKDEGEKKDPSTHSVHSGQASSGQEKKAD